MLNATPALRLYARWRRRKLEALRPVEMQEAQLLRLVRHAQETRFGRDHGFASLRSVADFQRQVPLRRFEDFWGDYGKDLGIIDAKAFSDLYREFKRRGWRDPPFEEPAVMLAEEEEPKRFERLCLRALAENVIGESRAAEMLGISMRDLDARLEQAA